MGAQPLVLGDEIMGQCLVHLIPSASGTQPAGALPFSAPLTMGLYNLVLIGGKAAAVIGSSGVNTPPHPGIVDPAFAAPIAQVGRVASGSATVKIGGKPAATVQSQVLMCAAPGKAVPSVTNVTIG